MGGRKAFGGMARFLLRSPSAPSVSDSEKHVKTRHSKRRGGSGWMVLSLMAGFLCSWPSLSHLATFVPGWREGGSAPSSLTSRTGPERTGLARAAETAEATKVDVEQKNWFEQTKDFWNDLEVFLPMEEDQSPEAIALMNQTQKVEKLTEDQEALLAKKSYLRGRSDQALGDELNKLQSLSYEYWKMRVYRVFSKESVKQGFVSFLTYGNAIFILIFLRTVVPRLLVISSMDDFFGFANEIGVPNRQTLNDVIRTLASYDLPFKVGIYTLAFIFEKITLISEILPVQVALKTMSPVVFGGLIPGALIAATCETVGATVNFFIGRQFFFQRVRDFQLPGEPILGDAPWFARLEKAAQTEGFKMTLLLRLSHILPVPFDSYWYILGALPVGVVEFVAAHWIGCLKTAFLDASLGLLLLTSVVNFDGAGKQNIIVAESLGFAIVALLVQTFATTLVKDILGLEEEKSETSKDKASPEDSVPKSAETETRSNSPSTEAKTRQNTESRAGSDAMI